MMVLYRKAALLLCLMSWSGVVVLVVLVVLVDLVALLMVLLALNRKNVALTVGGIGCL